MSISDILFLLQLLIVLGITVVKFYNIMSYGKFYEMAKGWILFIGFFMSYGVGFFIFLVDNTNTLIMTLFKFETLFVLVNVGFLVIEILMGLSVKQEDLIKTSYNTKKKK